jgi:hypothetical protein
MIVNEDLDLEWFQLLPYSNPSSDDDYNVPLSSFREPGNAFDLSMMADMLPFHNNVSEQSDIMKFSEFETLSFPLDSNFDSSDLEGIPAGEMTVDLDATNSLDSNDDTAFSTSTLRYDGLLLQGRSIPASNSTSTANLQLITPNSPDNPHLPSDPIPTHPSESNVPTTSAIDSSKTGQHVFQVELATKPKR